MRGETQSGELLLLWEELDEVFKYGKRSALRQIKDVLARHETLKKPVAGSAEVFGEGGYEVVPSEEEEEYHKRAGEMNRRIRSGMYADVCNPV